MSGELRLVSLAHGLLLGLLLAAPVLAPAILPHATMALFLLGGFQLRLADRRFTLRGAESWISHIRMTPRRLLPWGAAALGALASGHGGRAAAILLAALAGETLLYPLCANALARQTRMRIALFLLPLMALSASVPVEAVAFAAAFLTGVATCLFWLRGPDGEARAFVTALCILTLAGIAALLEPALLPWMTPLATVSALLALAHLSVLRRRPVPWRQPGGGSGSFLRRPLWQHPLRQP
ncbi:hypothetical protein SAMIE_1025550 [Sphingobium amiense]|uniref:Uncharacterized protein n=1 Tax=Sphingobium amiense TaxID=135719 RepID=A0A494W3E0_9SPHN|nr:hypothetical protein [Sphingobium amiense]BBD99054.1 hypothetical protein SAMIE_1025550 [Sphingobium amiense]